MKDTYAQQISIRGPLAQLPEHDVTLRYPASWHASVNPHAPAVERKTLEWLRAIGVVTDEETLQRFWALAVGAYGGWPFPCAREEQLDMITRFLTLWIYYDDGIEGEGEARADLLAAAIRGEPCTGREPNACIRGWREIAAQYRRSMSGGWLTRHAERYMEWLGSVRREAPFMQRYREASATPTIEEFLSLRRVTIGVLPTLDFIEYVTGQELPGEVLRHPAFAAIERRAAEAVAFPNELFGFSKDRKARWLNAVTCLAAGGAPTDRAAIEQAAEMHNRCIDEIVALEQELLAEVDDRPLVERWLEAMHHVVHGFARWHEAAPRYTRVHALEDGSRLRIAVRYG